MKELILGALKSFVAGATGVIVALNIVDPSKFSVSTVGGWKQLGIVVLIAGGIQEVRFLQQWANAVNPSGANAPAPAPIVAPPGKASKPIP
jgi:hypothetical protein